MTTGLDDRQRAMLAEMGIRVWAPRAVPAVTPPSVRFVLRGPVASFNEDATSTQVHVSIAVAAFDAPSDDGPALRVLNRVLGGAPGSRLNDDLRTARGLTYGFESDVRGEGGASRASRSPARLTAPTTTRALSPGA